ncbi:hypothetical protein GWI33_016338 [Rhynchophorus ferrugineus]|uniref:Uncharacterized protein n=1 Tax=Rhynchophorus ferrugineus TaxID=354439 RepID=A0A834I3Q9_RHYFE|nr:hypothetical protein GWI33_016338 [Rhynchophorus ferrugineus]
MYASGNTAARLRIGSFHPHPAIARVPPYHTGIALGLGAESTAASCVVGCVAEKSQDFAVALVTCVYTFFIVNFPS